MAFSIAIGSRIYAVDVEDHVAVIGHYALTVFRTTAQFHQLARHCTTCHRDNFYWQREFAQNINLLGSVCNTDKFFRNRSNDFHGSAPRRRL